MVKHFPKMQVTEFGWNDWHNFFHGQDRPIKRRRDTSQTRARVACHCEMKTRRLFIATPKLSKRLSKKLQPHRL